MNMQTKFIQLKSASKVYNFRANRLPSHIGLGIIQTKFIQLKSASKVYKFCANRLPSHIGLGETFRQKFSSKVHQKFTHFVRASYHLIRVSQKHADKIYSLQMCIKSLQISCEQVTFTYKSHRNMQTEFIHSLQMCIKSLHISCKQVTFSYRSCRNMQTEFIHSKCASKVYTFCANRLPSHMYRSYISPM